MNLTLEDIEDVQRQIDRLRKQLEAKDKFKNLKKAYSEGAIIEFKTRNGWKERNVDWSYELSDYRIKGDISIASWNKHKDVIKQFWNGAKVEFTYNGGFPQTVDSNIAWSIDCEYKVKPFTWKLPEYEDGAREVVFGSNQVTHSNNKAFTSSGRRRTTEALAERCAKASKERDLLEAYRDHLEPDYVDPDWDDSSVNKYYIYLNKGKYAVAYNFNAKDLGKVYGSQETMTQICSALNTREITLHEKN